MKKQQPEKVDTLVTSLTSQRKHPPLIHRKTYPFNVVAQQQTTTSVSRMPLMENCN